MVPKELTFLGEESMLVIETKVDIKIICVMKDELIITTSVEEPTTATK